MNTTVVHMHHFRRNIIEATHAFLARPEAVCATPRECPARYARLDRVGLVLDSELVRFRGRTVAFSVDSISPDGSTMGDSWLWAGQITTPDVTEFFEYDRDSVAHDAADKVSADLDDQGAALAHVVEVWILPVRSRLVGIEVDASVYAERRADVDALAAEFGVPLTVVSWSRPADQVGDPEIIRRAW